MSSFPVLGITGGVGCGKSTVGRVLQDLGVAVVDADQVAHEVLERPEIRARLASELGPLPLDGKGLVDRARLAQKVFADAGIRQVLEKVIHPAVAEQIHAWLKDARTRGPAAALIPLLFEAGLTEGWTAIWCVSASPAVAQARMQARGWTAEQWAARQAAQMPLPDKEQRSDWVLHNDGSLDELASQVRVAWMKVMKRSTGTCRTK